MAAKKKKTATKSASKPAGKTYGNKTKFVLGLPRELSAKQVVDEAKKNGITITEAHVYKIRSTAKSKLPKASKASASAGRPSSGGSLSKRDFVLSFGQDTKASEILRKAKEQGIGLSKAYLYTIRSAGGASQKRGGGRAAGGAGRVTAAVRSAGSFANHEAQFIDSAIHVGLAKAGELLDRLRARLKSGF
jgi:type III secretion system FlhB-like substrate exporter